MSTTNIISFAWLSLAVFAVMASYGFHTLKRFEINSYAQGTTYSIIYYAADSVVTKKQTDSLLSRLDKSVSLYLPTSLICRFNRSAKGIEVDEPFRILVQKAIAINKATNGAVDVTVKPLVDAWGFGANKPELAPDDKTIQRILKNVGTGKIWLKGSFLHKKYPGVQIDLNGIAQGYSADLLAGLLEKHHVWCYIAEIGGELRIKGRKPDGEKFTVGIEAIDGNDMAPGPIRKVISFTDGAVTTSGNYRKHLQSGGKQISHIINPKTGYPAQTGMISVTVYAKDAITADGYDNGFMAMGLKKTLTFLANQNNMQAYIVYKKSDGTVADTATNGFKAYELKR
ncbi:FAD:protein FMN transferase [Mucilaginibacter terrae]|uniref:FAD:protein FMN transferase n=1 Tax=Mucilaginibacter terrae TaxID=1955052 RepID=A0ABU3GY52_9SPHI|nr:FAD:protein FMN transferase [Mucilaginibacter terrae]MDT3404361.1 thiamine biosynthesis lipoprotein [Mucilaginibacter terrae]